MPSRLIKKKEQVKIQDKFMQLEREDGELKLRLGEDVEGKGDELPFLVAPDTVGLSTTISDFLDMLGIDVSTLSKGFYFYTVYIQNGINYSTSISSGFIELTVNKYPAVPEITIKQANGYIYHSFSNISLNDTFEDVLRRSSNITTLTMIANTNSERVYLTKEHGSFYWKPLCIHTVKLKDSDDNYLGTLSVILATSEQLNLPALIYRIYAEYYNSPSTTGTLPTINCNGLFLKDNTALNSLKGVYMTTRPSMPEPIRKLYTVTDTITLSNGSFTSQENSTEVASIEYVSVMRLL